MIPRLINLFLGYLPNFLMTLNCLNILNYLFKAKLEKKVKDSSAVIPVSWLEARIANIKVNAIENAKTLQKNFDMKC